MQQLQLVSFALAMAALVVCGYIFTLKSRKKYQLKPCAQRSRTNISPAVSLTKKKGAAIGRAAAYRPLKKLNQVCDPKADLARE